MLAKIVAGDKREASEHAGATCLLRGVPADFVAWLGTSGIVTICRRHVGLRSCAFFLQLLPGVATSISSEIPSPWGRRRGRCGRCGRRGWLRCVASGGGGGVGDGSAVRGANATAWPTGVAGNGQWRRPGTPELSNSARSLPLAHSATLPVATELHRPRPAHLGGLLPTSPAATALPLLLPSFPLPLSLVRDR